MAASLLSNHVFKNLATSVILPNLRAGLISGAIALSYSVAYGALIFAGDLSSFFAFGTGISLCSAALATLCLAWRSNFPFAIASPDPQVTAVLGSMVAAIISEMHGSQNYQVFPTIWMMLVIATGITGLCVLLLGKLQGAALVRFLPYPVVGGFLAGASFLIVQGAFRVSTGLHLSWQILGDLCTPDLIWHWLPSLGLALLVQFVVRYFQNLVLMPLMWLAAIAVTYGIFALQHISLSQAVAEGWLFNPALTQQSQFNIWLNWQIVIANWSAIDWGSLSAQGSNLLALILLVTIGILLNGSELEINTKTDVDLDRELQASGWANLALACVGGMVGYLSLSRSMLNYKSGGSNRLAPLISSLVCILVLWCGETWLFYFPKPVLSSLLFYAALGLLIDWVYKARRKLPWTEYLLLLAIVAVMAIAGFLRGIVVGMIFACLLFAFNYSHVSIVKYVLSGAERQSNLERSPQQTKLLQEHGQQIYILCLQGYLFFGTANSLLETIKQRLANAELPPLQFLILDFRWVNAMDSSAVLCFVKLRQILQQQSIHLVLTELPNAIQDQLSHSGYSFNAISEVMAQPNCLVFTDLDRGLESCETQLLGKLQKDRQIDFPLLLQLSEALIIEEPIAQLMNRLQKFATYLEKMDLPAAATLFRQGDFPEELYFLESGQVSILMNLPDGSQKRLRSLCAGTVIGEIGLYNQLPRSASAVTDCCSIVYRLSRSALAQMEEDDPKLATAFHQFVVRSLADRLAHSNKEIEMLMR